MNLDHRLFQNRKPDCLKIVANGKQCPAATILNVDGFPSVTREDEAIDRRRIL